MRQPFMKYVSCYLAFIMFLIGIAPKVDASFVPSEIIKYAQIDRVEDMEKVQKVLELKMVKQRLEALGFTEGEIQTRLSQLSDEQIHNIALNLEQLRTGGDGVGLVIGLLVIAILVVLLIQLTGHRVIVK